MFKKWLKKESNKKEKEDNKIMEEAFKLYKSNEQLLKELYKKAEAI